MKYPRAVRLLYLLLVVSPACGRIGFDRGNASDDGGKGSNAQPRVDAGPALSCSHYTTLEACRREPGCTPIVCDDCPCETPTLGACVGRGDNAAINCPAIACTGCCLQDGDCNTGEVCQPPDAMTCGLCNPDDIHPPCSTNVDCTDSTCAKPNCQCAPSCQQITCTTDFNCEGGEYCAAAGYCLPRTCSGDTDCPPDHGCDHGVCTRRTCTSNTECSNYCVGVSCYSARGTCMLNPS